MRLSMWYKHFVWQMVGLPRYGTLSVNGSVLRQSEVFSQQDVTMGRVRYKLLRTAYSLVHDGVSFRVAAPQCQALAPTTLRFLHTPPSQLTQRVSVVLRTLQVNFNFYWFCFYLTKFETFKDKSNLRKEMKIERWFYLKVSIYRKNISLEFFYSY